MRPTSAGRATFAVASIAVAASFAFVYWDTVARLAATWLHDQNYSHGMLVIPIALLMAWNRRRSLALAPKRPANAGFLIVLASLAVNAVGVLGAEYFLSRLSMLGVIGGSVLFVFGRNHLRIVALPLLFLVLMIPIPAIIFNQVAVPLQLFASQVGEAALRLAGVPVLREGNVIVLSSLTLEVAEACSGIRSLMSLLTLSIVYGYVAERRTSVRVLLAIASVSFAIVANGARVAGTGIAGQFVGPAAAQGFFHEFSGLAAYLVAFGMLLLLHAAVTWGVLRAKASEPHATRIPTSKEIGRA